MTSRFPIFAFFIVFLTLSHAFAGSLIWVERKSDNDRDLLISRGIPLIEEFSSGFLAEGDANLVQTGLDQLGFRSQVLDKDADRSSYAVFAFRNGTSRPDALASCGTALWSRENWTLLKVRMPMSARCAENTAWFSRLLSRSQLRPAVPPPAEYLAAPFAVKPLVQDMVNSLTNTKIQAHWNDVVTSTSTRYSTSSGCQTAAQAVFNKLQSYNLNPVFQNHTSGHAPNVIGTRVGAVYPDRVYIVIGHLDDFPSSGPAPGADDNASGSSLVTMLGDVMSCYAFTNTIKFIAVTGEEFGLFGSTYYADDALARGENIQGVLNGDMIGWEGDGSPAPENLDLDYNSASQWLGLLFAQCAQDYGTGCVVDAFSCPSLTASDHAPFWANGWSAVCGITDNEGYCGHGGNYPFYHTSNDTIPNCGDPSFYYGAARAYIATLGHLADPFKIRFDRDAVGCSASVLITVGDRDLNTNPSVQESVAVQVWSTTEPGSETVVLTEQDNNSMLFSGTLTTTPDPPVGGDGLVSVTEGDTLTAQYTDAVACNGSVNVAYTDAATVTDCAAPVISNVAAGNITPDSALVTWNTNETANSRTTHAPAPGPPVINTDDLSTFGTSHAITITGLNSCTDYVFTVTSADTVGNSFTDNNAGSFYNFSTGGLGYFLSDDAENGDSDWIPGGTGTSDFHLDTCKSNSPTRSWKAGSAACPGVYASGVTTTLTSTSTFSIEIGSKLRFAENHITQPGSDLCKVQISTNGGSSWTSLDSYSGDSGGWQAKDYDLSAYAGSSARIRFLFTSNASVSYEGWYIDDIQVTRTIPCVPAFANKQTTVIDTCALGGAGNNNGILDPGETAVLQIAAVNLGSVPATVVSGHLSTSTPGVTVTDADAAFPDIGPGATRISVAPHFTIDVAASVPCGADLQFHMDLTTDQGPLGYDFAIPVGAPTTATVLYNPTDVPVPVPDSGSITSTIDITDTHAIRDVNITLNILHPFDADLDVMLLGPGAAPPVELSTDNGGSGDNYTNTVFDDQSAASITDGTAPFTGAFHPEGHLSDINGLGANGAWTLNLVDDASGNSGMLLSWSMTVTTDTGGACTLCAPAPTCLFCDEFDDDGAEWSYLKPAWNRTGGKLVAIPGRKAIAVAVPAFTGCTNCYVESTMESAGGPGNKLWMLGWFIDKKNTVELLMKEGSDKWILKQRVNGKIVAKASISSAIAPNVAYTARITFDGSLFRLAIDGAEVLTLAPGSPVLQGTVGFAASGTTGSFEYVHVNP